MPINKTELRFGKKLSLDGHLCAFSGVLNAIFIPGHPFRWVESTNHSPPVTLTLTRLEPVVSD